MIAISTKAANKGTSKHIGGEMNTKVHTGITDQRSPEDADCSDGFFLKNNTCSDSKSKSIRGVTGREGRASPNAEFVNERIDFKGPRKAKCEFE